MPNMGMKIKKPEIRIPGVDININGPKFEDEFNSLTLKEICNRDIYDPIHLSVNVKPINSYIDNIKGEIPSLNKNINKPKVNFDENIEIGEIPKNNSPNINLSSYTTITNKSIKLSDLDRNTRKTLQASISSNIIGASYNPFYNRKTIDVRANPFKSVIGNNYRKTEYNNNRNKFNNTITLKELCSKDVNDTVIINKNAISIKLHDPSKLLTKSQISYEYQNGQNNSINMNLMNEKSPNKINIGLNPNLNINASYKINKSEQNPFKSAKAITLRELFNGDVESKVHIKKQTLSTNNEIIEEEGDFDFPDDNEIKTLNIVSSGYKGNSQNEQNEQNANKVNLKANINVKKSGNNGLISDNEE